MNDTTSLELPAELMAAIAGAAERQGQSPAQWVAENLRQQLAQPPGARARSAKTTQAAPPEKTAADRQRALHAVEKLTPFDLPIGVYVVTTDGQFIKCHEKVRELLRLPKQGDITQSIVEFYCDPQRREELKQKLTEAEQANGSGQWVEKEVLAFEVEGREIFVQDYTRSLQDPETKETIGYVCCMVDVTEEETYRRLFEQLPIGVYQLDEQDKITRVNRAWYEMLGYEPDAAVIGLPAQAIYENAEDAQELRQKIEQEGVVVNQKLKLRKQDGEVITISVSAFKLKDPDGNYAGRIGTLMNVTNEERYRRILEDVPVGLYEIRVRNGEAVIAHCNQKFADLFEFQSREEVIGKPARELHISNEEYDKFLQHLGRAFGQNQPLHFVMKTKTQKGNEIVLDISSRPLGGKSGDNVDRVGAARDITEEVRLKQLAEKATERVDKVTKDIGAILHTYESSLLKIKNSTRAIRDSLGDNPFAGSQYLLPEKAANALIEPAKHLASSLERLLQLAVGERAAALAPEKWQELDRLLRLLKNYHRTIPYLEAYPSTLRELARKLMQLQGELAKGNFPREPVRQLREDARELLRICNLISLHQMRDVIADLEYPLGAVRRYVVSGFHEKEKREVRKVTDLVSLAVSRLTEFAENRGVQLRSSVEPPSLQVAVIEHEILRALGNLLHNAIKYSWVRKKGEPLWVSISAHRVDGEVHLEVENWGVPIPQEEIERELIFDLAYRGIKSNDRGRVGTGIGLHDSRELAREHGGDVTIKSVPANPLGLRDDYDQPFLTIATMKLPLFTR